MMINVPRAIARLAAVTALLAPPCLADTYPRQPGVDVIHYAFRLTLRDESDEIDGAATVDVKFLADGSGGFPPRPGLVGGGQGDDGLGA